MQIPMLNDVISRGAKAPPVEDVLDESAFTSDDDPAVPESTMEIDSEAVTVYPDFESDDDPKPFNLDELTEPRKELEEDAETNDPVERAMQSLMPKLETMAREAIKTALVDIKSEKSSDKEKDD